MNFFCPEQGQGFHPQRLTCNQLLVEYPRGTSLCCPEYTIDVKFPIFSEATTTCYYYFAALKKEHPQKSSP